MSGDEAQFKITCAKCGCDNVYIDDSRGWSEETGPWGSIDLICRGCGNDQDVDDLRRALDKRNDE